jgi:hypothetical protein
LLVDSFLTVFFETVRRSAPTPSVLLASVELGVAIMISRMVRIFPFSWPELARVRPLYCANLIACSSGNTHVINLFPIQLAGR